MVAVMGRWHRPAGLARDGPIRQPSRPPPTVDYFQSSRLARVMIVYFVVLPVPVEKHFRLCLKAPQRFWLNCLDALKDPHDLVVRFFGEVVSLL
jgi:hypothetical protein